MRAQAGDILMVRSHHIGEPQKAVVPELRGDNGEPPFLVRWSDGYEGLIFPGSDASVQHRRRRVKGMAG